MPEQIRQQAKQAGATKTKQLPNKTAGLAARTITPPDMTAGAAAEPSLQIALQFMQTQSQL